MGDTHVCDDCTQLFLEPEHLQVLCSDFSLHNVENHTLSYRRNIAALKSNSIRGCLLCRKLVDWFKLDTDLWQGVNLGLSDKSPGEEVVFALYLVDVAPLVLSVSLKAVEGRGDTDWLAFELLTTPDDPAAQYFPGRLANHDVGSYQSFKLVRQWMTECEINHPNCTKVEEPILPTRVLDLFSLESPTGLNLFLTDGQTGEYACLSYCWGSSTQPLQLTYATLPSLLLGISPTHLPQSIQDAILTAWKLGIRYLWVDALCILQDSDEDKGREIERMDQIYRNANLTIAAANADDCSSGFLTRRDRWWSDTDGPPIRLPFLCPDWTEGSISLVRYGTPGGREPLYSRSWPFQEHLLSPRVLMYGSEQVLWVCQQDSPIGTGATFKDGGPAYDSSVTELKYMRMFLHKPAVISPGFARRNLWIDLVAEYSPRKQSIPDDKIHALRGIASRYQHHMKDEYIAGLWKSWLLPGLMWKRYQEIQGQQKRQYPSWSWLSIDSGVVMEKANDDIYNFENLYNVEYVDYIADIDDKSLSPFGLLPNAILHLRGHITRLDDPVWSEMRSSSINPKADHVRFLRPQPARIVLDSMTLSDLAVGERNVWCLPIIRTKVVDQRIDRYGCWAVQGLLLLQDPDLKYYTRIGWFISNVGDRTDFLGGAPRQEIFLR